MKLKLVFYSIFLLGYGLLLGQDHTEWSYNLGVYEVNVRQYTQEGTFEAFETHLERLKEMGVGVLWFMPIHPIGERNRLGSLGSYYSVKDYLDVNPEYGTLDDFKRLVSKAHEMGFYVIIDWIANHTAWDNPLTYMHSDWYTKGTDGKFMPPAGTNWTDVIDLDYSKEGLHEYMIDAMKFWINEIDIDGFRYDAASWVPSDFWQTAITELKNIKPEILMLAEADGTEYENMGFDMTFAWGLYGFGYGVFPNIVSNSYDANFLASFFRDEYNKYSRNHYRMYFTSNHDENSWHGTVFERFGNSAEIFAAITLTMSGMPLIYNGQEVGLNKRLKFFDKDQISWNSHPFTGMYSTLLNLKKENKALWNGDKGGIAVRVLTNNNPDIYSFIREMDNDKVFAMFNLSNDDQTVVPGGELYHGVYTDVFSKDTIVFSEGTETTLSPWDYKIYEYISSISSVDYNELMETSFTLEQNYPNPFNPTTTIKYSIPSENTKVKNVTLNVFNILGKKITTLVNQKQKFGSYTIQFDASNLSSGVYYYQLTAGKFIQTNKMIILK